jgi:hypothetical protein
LHKELAKKLEELEGKFMSHDIQIQEIFNALKGLMDPPVEPAPQIGFRPPIDHSP